MKWYLSMNDRNLRRSSQQFIECAKTFSYLFPLMENYLNQESFISIQAEWENLCKEFDARR